MVLTTFAALVILGAVPDGFVSMKTSILTLATLLTIVICGRPDFNPIGLTADSFTQDVIVEKSATPPAQTLVTANMDAGTNVTGTVGGTGGNHASFYEIGYGTTAGSGLPLHSSVFNAASNANHTFQMPPDYTAPNAVYVGGAGSVSPQVLSGELDLVTPASFTHLSILGAAAGGPTYVQYTVNYSDGNVEQQTIVMTDWTTTNNASTANTAWTANGWLQGSDGSYQKVATTPQTGRLFYFDVPLNFTSSLITNVVFTFESGGRAVIFGLSGSTDGGTTFRPINVTGFNYDMVIEAPLAKTVTATIDAGLLIPASSTTAINRGDNNTLFEQGFNLINPSTTPIPRAQNGLPHPGTIFNALSNATHAFQMPPTYVGPCVVMVNSQVNGGTLTLNTPAALSALSILSTAGSGPLTVAVTVNHQDGSSEITSYLCPDWFGALTTNQNVAYIAAGRVPMGRLNTINNGGTATGTIVWYNDIPLSNQSSPVTSVQFSYTTGNGRAVVFGLSGSTDGTSFTPLGVTGFNQDVVVEANAITNMDLRAFSSASMDGGTNNNANIWYEQGWNTLAPASGLPPAGSIITSTNLTDHHYQFASDYTKNNVVYCDSNNPTATITFATPNTFSAVSFLSANANQGIQIKVILNHQSAPSETNVFNSKDWFNGAPAAFTADGRCSSDNRSANNWLPGTSNPHLYEAQFAVADTVHNVTGATLIWTTNNGAGGVSAANSRFVVLAVSGTTGSTAPLISSIVPQNFAGFDGTNFTLAATAGGSPAPSYQWQAGPIGSGVFTNVVDNAIISGSTTATLSFTGARIDNSADYQLVASNPVGTATSSTATVKILSALPNVLAAGDSISQFGGTSPAGQDATHAIDHVVGTNKFLNFGANGAAPFAGPVGFVVTPSMGSTVVSAMRVYPGNDHEERDPADYILEGSNDGTNWAQISSGPLALPSARTVTGALNPLTEPLQELRFANSSGYISYRFTVNNTKTNAVANSMALGEIELLGTLNPTPPYFTVQPVSSVTNFVGGSPTFSVLALGPTPIAYQWRRDSSNIPGATGTSYTLTNAQMSDSGHQFTCVASNQYGATPSSSSLLTVIAAPTNSYPSAVLADHPIAFWRLDENPDNAAGNNGTAVIDYVGGHNGTYSNVTIGVAGYSPAADTNTAATFSGTPASFAGGIGGIDFAAPNGTAPSLSVEAWVLSGVPGGGVQAGDDGIITKGNGAAEQFNLDTGGNDPAHNFRFYVRDAAGATHAAIATNGPDGNWHHLVAVCDGVNGNVKLYIDGRQNGTVGTIGAVGLLSSPIPVSIGARKQNATSDYNLAFNGTLDEVAIYNYALSAKQAATHYLVTQPAAVLNIQRVDPSTVSLTWPAISGFVLQSTTDLNLGAGGWQDVAGASGGQATVPVGATPQFFRLIYR
jgi:hypothetical protein